MCVLGSRTLNEYDDDDEMCVVMPTACCSDYSSSKLKLLHQSLVNYRVKFKFATLAFGDSSDLGPCRSIVGLIHERMLSVFVI